MGVGKSNKAADWRKPQRTRSNNNFYIIEATDEDKAQK